MNFTWYFGFGWKTIIALALLGAASRQFAEGWLYWLVYGMFALTAAYAVTRFRLYKREPWRRVHHRGFEIIRSLINADANSADGRRDPQLLTRKLAQALLGDHAAAALPAAVFTETGRKEYYRQLVADFPLVFMQNLPIEKQAEAQGNILQDIEASEFGPDIVIAAVIEKQYGRLEAARYLLAMASGYIK